MRVSDVADIDSCGIAAKSEIAADSIQVNGALSVADRKIGLLRDGEFVIHAAIARIRVLGKAGDRCDAAADLIAIHLNLIGSGSGRYGNLGSGRGLYINCPKLVGDGDS